MPNLPPLDLHTFLMGLGILGAATGVIVALSRYRLLRLGTFIAGTGCTLAALGGTLYLPSLLS